MLAIDLDQRSPASSPTSRGRRPTRLIAQNASAYTSSRNLFIGVAAGAIVLALLLGFVLSWSLIGPIQRIDTRLAGDRLGRLLAATSTSTTATSSARSARTSTG